VTALLLGELSAEEAAGLRQTISQDAALAKLHERLRLTLDLLRATAATSAGELSEQTAPLKLSPARREMLLAHFKKLSPKELARSRGRKVSFWVEMAALAAILIVAVGVALPKLGGVGAKARNIGRVETYPSTIALSLARVPRTNGTDRMDRTDGTGASGGLAMAASAPAPNLNPNRPAPVPASPPKTFIYTGNSAEGTEAANNFTFGTAIHGGTNGADLSRKEAGKDTNVQVFLLTYADANAIASELKDVFSTPGNAQTNAGLGSGSQIASIFGGGGFRGGGGGSGESAKRAGELVNAVADNQNNAVLINASPDLMPGISNLITKLDIPQEDTTQTRLFFLTNADSTATANELQRFFAGPSGGGTAQFAGAASSGANGGPQKQGVTAVADPRTQSVLITAPRDTMDQIEKIVDEWDNSETVHEPASVSGFVNNGWDTSLPQADLLAPRGVAYAGSVQESGLQQRMQQAATQSSITASTGIGSSGGAGGRGSATGMSDRRNNRGRGAAQFGGAGGFGGTASAGMVAAAPASAPQPATSPQSSIYMGKTEAGGNAGSADQGLTVNLRGVSVDQALSFLAESQGLNINRQAGTAFSGNVDLTSETPLNKDETIALVNKVLADHNLTTVRDGNTLTVMSIQQAADSGVTPIYAFGNTVGTPADSDIVTEMIPVHTLNAAEVSRDLYTLLPRGAKMDTSDAGNSIVVTGKQADIKRMAQTISALDSTGNGNLQVFHLNDANSKQVASELKDLFTSDGNGEVNVARGSGVATIFGSRGGRGGGGAGDEDARRFAPGVNAVADERNNAIVVSAPPDYMPGISNLIGKADNPKGANDAYPQTITVGQVGPPKFANTGSLSFSTSADNQANVEKALEALEQHKKSPVDLLAGDGVPAYPSGIHTLQGVPVGGVFSINGVGTNWSDQLHSAGNQNGPGNVALINSGGSGGAAVGQGYFFYRDSDDIGGVRNLNRTNGAASGALVAGSVGEIGEMETRVLHLPTNVQGLGGVIAGSGGIGGIAGRAYAGDIGGYGGGIGGIGGGGIGGGGYGGGIGGGGTGGQIQGSASYPTVNAAPTGSGGAGGANSVTGGIPYATRPTETAQANGALSRYLTNTGVNITSNGAFAFYNENSGDMLVRASKPDLEKIEKTLDLLDKTPPETPIDARFASVTSNDSKGVGFETHLGNFTVNNGAIGAQAGTAPSFTGPSTYANPSGIFPGAGPVRSIPGQVSQPASDGSLTSAALRTVAPNAKTTNGLVSGTYAGGVVGEMGNITFADRNSTSRLDGVSPYREVGGPATRKAELMGVTNRIVAYQAQNSDDVDLIGPLTDLFPQANGRTSTSASSQQNALLQRVQTAATQSSVSAQSTFGARTGGIVSGMQSADNAQRTIGSSGSSRGGADYFISEGAGAMAVSGSGGAGGAGGAAHNASAASAPTAPPAMAERARGSALQGVPKIAQLAGDIGTVTFDDLAMSRDAFASAGNVGVNGRIADNQTHSLPSDAGKNVAGTVIGYVDTSAVRQPGAGDKITAGIYFPAADQNSGAAISPMNLIDEASKANVSDVGGGFNGLYWTNTPSAAARAGNGRFSANLDGGADLDLYAATANLNGGVLPNAATLTNGWSTVAGVVTPPQRQEFEFNLEARPGSAYANGTAKLMNIPTNGNIFKTRTNEPIGNGAVIRYATDLGAYGEQAGTNPAYTGKNTVANPSGVFPDSANAKKTGSILGGIPIIGGLFKQKEEPAHTAELGANFNNLSTTFNMRNLGEPSSVSVQQDKLLAAKKAEATTGKPQITAFPRSQHMLDEREAKTPSARLSFLTRTAEGTNLGSAANSPYPAQIAMTNRSLAPSTNAAGRGLPALPSPGNRATNQIIAKMRAIESSAPAIRNPQSAIRNLDAPPPKPASPPPVPQPEVQTRDNAFSTFSLNVSDVSFRLAVASLEKGLLPDASTVRSEEFINAFNYRDSEPAPGAPIGFASERAGYPFAHNRDLLRFSVKTASEGRQADRPLNLVLLLDKSGSMERADRVAIIREALRVLATQLKAQDTVSVVIFARTSRLFADAVSGSRFGALAAELEALTPEGGTNLEEAMRLAYETALRHYLSNGENRVVLLTDGAANLGDVEPGDLKKKVEANRAQGIALDCFGVGWEDYNDNLLEVLSRSGGGRYGFVNTPEEAATGFAGQLAGALRVAASDVKVQVEFNPERVISYRQIGYAKDQLKKEEFRDNSVKAAQISVAESGNALYTVELNPAGDGPICTVYVRYRTPGTSDYHEHAWAVPYTGAADPLDKASPPMRLAATASAFAEWLAGSPYAGEVTLNKLQGYLRGVPEFYGADARPKLLETMLREAGR